MSSDGEPPLKRRSDWAAANAHKTLACQTFLQEKYDTIREWSKEAFEEHGLSEHRFQANLISENFTSATSRGDTKWNAVLSNSYHHAKEEYTAGRAEESPGKYWEWIPKAMPDIRDSYLKMTDQQRKDELKEFTTRRDLKNKETLKERRSGSGFSRSVAATGNRITKLIDDLNTATGAEAIVLLAPGDPRLQFTPMFHTTGTAKKFLKDVELIRKEPATIAKMLEGYCASGVAGTADLRASITKASAAKTRSEISTKMQAGLDAIIATVLPAGSTIHLKMNYRNFEGVIVEPYGVALVGWPLPDKPVSQPAQLNAGECMRVNRALDDGTLHWVRLSTQELEERKVRNKVLQAAGQNVYIPRKPRAKKRRIEQVEA